MGDPASPVGPAALPAWMVLSCLCKSLQNLVPLTICFLLPCLEHGQSAFCFGHSALQVMYTCHVAPACQGRVSLYGACWISQTQGHRPGVSFNTPGFVSSKVPQSPASRPLDQSREGSRGCQVSENVPGYVRSATGSFGVSLKQIQDSCGLWAEGPAINSSSVSINEFGHLNIFLENGMQWN